MPEALDLPVFSLTFGVARVQVGGVSSMEAAPFHD